MTGVEACLQHMNGDAVGLVKVTKKWHFNGISHETVRPS